MYYRLLADLIVTVHPFANTFALKALGVHRPPFFNVVTDMVTHACVSGQHAFIDPFIVPKKNCRQPALTPYALLEGAPS